MRGIWSLFRRCGRFGELLLVCLLLMYVPTILLWILAIDASCWVKGRLWPSAENETPRVFSVSSILFVDTIGAAALVANSWLLWRMLFSAFGGA
jgi:hypothetical protein